MRRSSGRLAHVQLKISDLDGVALIFVFGLKRYFYVYLGFINALFLMVIALFIFLEAIERLIEPPDVKTDKLLVSKHFQNDIWLYL